MPSSRTRLLTRSLRQHGSEDRSTRVAPGRFSDSASQSMPGLRIQQDRKAPLPCGRAGAPTRGAEPLGPRPTGRCTVKFALSLGQLNPTAWVAVTEEADRL